MLGHRGRFCRVCWLRNYILMELLSVALIVVFILIRAAGVGTLRTGYLLLRHVGLIKLLLVVGREHV